MDGETGFYDYNAEQLKAFAKLRNLKQPTIAEVQKDSQMSPSLREGVYVGNQNTVPDNLLMGEADAKKAAQLSIEDQSKNGANGLLKDSKASDAVGDKNYVVFTKKDIDSIIKQKADRQTFTAD